MKVNTARELTNVYGEPLQENGVTLTFGRVLASLLDKTQAKTPDERLAAYHLAKRCAAPECELSSGEVELLRTLAASLLGSNVIAGQVIELLPISPILTA